MKDYSQQKDLTIFHLKIKEDQPFAFLYKNDILNINVFGQESLDFNSGWVKFVPSITFIIEKELFDDKIKKCIYDCIIERDPYYNDYGKYLLIISKTFKDNKILYYFNRFSYRPTDLKPDEYWQKYVNRLIKVQILY